MLITSLPPLLPTAFVPPIPGRTRPGVFVYRTIEDLEAMLAYAKENNVKSAAVIGGGLLGLEAAKAVADMNVESHIIEFAPILMCRQIDQGGHNALVGKIEDMGLKVHCDARTAAFVGTDGSTDDESDAPVSALRFSNEGWDDLPVQMVGKFLLEVDCRKFSIGTLINLLTFLLLLLFSCERRYQTP